MCNKCKQHHSELFKNHHSFNLAENKINYTKETFTGICQEKNHSNKLIYFCKNQNSVCCAECITKIKGKENGQHTDCDICFIEDIENEKNIKLKENIKILEELYNDIEKSIEDNKNIYEKINNKKEELITEIQKIFTNLRNVLNNREDELLLEVEKIFNEEYLNDEIINQLDKLPLKVKTYLEKGKLIIQERNKNDKINYLNSFINDCVNIENNIKEISYITEKTKTIKTSNINLSFFPQGEDKINNIKEVIKNFGDLKKINLFNSNIKFDEGLVITWLNNRKFTTDLLYRKTRDGSKPENFHNKCDKKGITITFIKTTKGYKFGGYTELPLDKSGSGKKDKSTFLFSLVGSL